MDFQFLTNLGCVFSLRTKQPSKPHCTVDSSLFRKYNIFRKKAFDTYCSNPCAKMDVSMITTSINTKHSKNEAMANFYFQYRIKVSRALFRYNELTLLAEVGGYLGLLLGISLLDIAKVFEWSMSLMQKRV